MLFRAMLVAFFILANSFFVAAEFALISVRETRLDQLIEHGEPVPEPLFSSSRTLTSFCPRYSLG